MINTDSFKEHKCCVLVPTYNNSGTLKSVLEGVLKHTQQIIVVNDGSTDNTSEILNEFKEIKLIEIAKNKGKGNALKEGFRLAYKLGYAYAISIDSDGQHNPDDLPQFLNAIQESPETLVVGARNMSQDGVPGRSSFGNKFSNFWYWIETGIKMPDTQSGFRLYPLRKLVEMKYFTRKFEFEIEIIVRAAWKGIPVKSIPISVYYAPEDERISHFRPFKDFFRISVLNTILVFLAFLYFRPLLFLKDFSYQKFQKLIGKGEPTSKLALAVGFGVFMGIVPIWGYQMIAAAFLAHLFKLNKAMVLLASNISFGPMVAVVIYLSFLAGRFFVQDPISLTFNKGIDLNTIKIAAVQYISGSIALAIAAGLSAGIAMFLLLLIRRNGKNLR